MQTLKLNIVDYISEDKKSEAVKFKSELKVSDQRFLPLKCCLL